jgi:hypothetical protein
MIAIFKIAQGQRFSIEITRLLQENLSEFGNEVCLRGRNWAWAGLSEHLA